MSRTVTIFIAVLPCDYMHADVEVFETIRGDTQYCMVLERKVVAE